MDLPLYVGETRYYRCILHISWEYGSKLRRTGILSPDAQLDDGRVLYLLSPETLAQNQAAIARSVTPKWKEARGAPGFLVPSSVFDLVGQPMTRDVTISGSGANLVGKKVRQLPGIIGWSAVVNSGAQVLGPFRDSNIQVYHDNPLPPATWLPEIGTITEADPGFVATVMSPKRICAQVAISRQLLVQSTGNQALDEFIASRIRLVFSPRLDQACLYGTGAANNQPQGVVSTPGTNLGECR